MRKTLLAIALMATQAHAVQPIGWNYCQSPNRNPSMETCSFTAVDPYAITAAQCTTRGLIPRPFPESYAPEDTNHWQPIVRCQSGEWMYSDLWYLCPANATQAPTWYDAAEEWDNGQRNPPPPICLGDDCPTRRQQKLTQCDEIDADFSATCDIGGAVAIKRYGAILGGAIMAACNFMNKRGVIVCKTLAPQCANS